MAILFGDIIAIQKNFNFIPLTFLLDEHNMFSPIVIKQAKMPLVWQNGRSSKMSLVRKRIQRLSLCFVI